MYSALFLNYAEYIFFIKFKLTKLGHKAMENQESDFKDYFKIFKRRIKFFVIPFLLISLIAVLLAVLLPSVYRSSATILIEEQVIPSDLVRSTVTTYADQRIQVISQRIMTRANLSGIIKKYNFMLMI